MHGESLPEDVVKMYCYIQVTYNIISCYIQVTFNHRIALVMSCLVSE